ncbi:MAG: carbohydrate-binding family 9-like protein [Planctomycetes bacterium]|nr:carbohydrate-binding family 9-like protein [Planctomycetota bacterium]
MKDPRRAAGAIAAAMAAAIALAAASCAGPAPIRGGSERTDVAALDPARIAELRAIRFPTGDGRDLALDDLRGRWFIAIAAERRSDALGRAWGKLVADYRKARRDAGRPDDLAVLGIADLTDLARILHGIARMQIRQEENPAGILIDAEGIWRRSLGYDPTRASIYLFDPEGRLLGELGSGRDPDAEALAAFLAPYAESTPLSPAYDVRGTHGERIRIDGDLDEPAWRRAVIETGFAFPWEAEAAPATTFRALHDGETLYFSFVVEDGDIIASEAFDGESTVDGEDRIEVFFARDARLRSYGCIEIDPRGRVHDYAARYYRAFDGAWKAADLRAAAGPVAGGYAVEAAIPFATLEALGLPVRNDPILRAGLYRAEFARGADGKIVERWLSWVDPKTRMPDFHVPESFGWLRLVE